MIVLRERNEGDVARFENSLMKAKSGIMEACEIFADMSEQFGERGGYSERYSGRGGYSERMGDSPKGYSGRDWEGMDERRSRDSMGRFR